MATYSQIHQNWAREYDNFTVYSSTAWVSPTIYVRSGGSWVWVTDPAASGPRMLARNGGLWVSMLRDRWSITVCRTVPGTSTNTYTIPSSIFGLSVNKVVTKPEGTVRSRMYSKQYGGGVNFVHAFTRNGSNVYSLSGKHDDGYTCSDNNWSNRGQFPSGVTFYPGDTIGVKVTVPDTFGNDYGGTRVDLSMQWYFN